MSVPLDTLLSGLPRLAISYHGFGATLERAGWRLTEVKPYGFGIEAHAEHRRRVEDNGKPLRASILVSQSDYPPEIDPSGDEWLHASIYLGDGITPAYEDLTTLHRAVFGRRRYAWQCFVPETEHINVKEVLHLFGRVDGRSMLPNFGALGSI